MKSLLVKFASVAVMIHMTFGCSLHHGIGTHACASHNAIGCGHDHQPDTHDCGSTDHEHHDHDHQHPSDSSPSLGLDAPGHGHGHFGCSDDSCSAIPFVKFEFEPLNFSVPYLGGAESTLFMGSRDLTGFAGDLFPDRLRARSALRAHLLFGVQIV